MNIYSKFIVTHWFRKKIEKCAKKNIAVVDKLYEDELLLSWFRNHKLFKINNNNLLLININGNLTQEKIHIEEF